MNAAEAANTGRQRTAIHNTMGNTTATGTAVAQGPGGREITNALVATRVTSTNAPSTCSRRGGARRMADASPIGSGATVTMPSAADVNQLRQTFKMSAAGSAIATTAVPLTAAASVPTAVAPKNPRTHDTFSSLNAGPNQRSMRRIVSKAPPVLQTARATASQKSPPALKRAAIIPTHMPVATGARASDPRAIRPPTARPRA